MNPFSLLTQLAKPAANLIQDKLGVDVTPGFNVTRSPGEGIPFVSHTGVLGATTGSAPSPQYVSDGSPSGDNTQLTSTTDQLAANAASAARSQNIAGYDQAIGQYNSQLDRLPNQEQIAIDNINRQFGVKKNELTTGYNQSKNTYDTSTKQNSQQYVTNKNQINDSFSSGLSGMLRMLGAYGANGSDRSLASGVASTDAARQRSGASQTFGQNQQGLDTNWGNYGLDYANSDKKLNDWQTEQQNSARATGLTNKQNILSKLAELQSSRASAAGGNATTAAQSYLDQINGIQGQVDQLGAVNPTYDGTTPVYQAPSLSSYTPTSTSGAVANNALESQASPFLSMLAGDKRKQQQLAY